MNNHDPKVSDACFVVETDTIEQNALHATVTVKKMPQNRTLGSRMPIQEIRTAQAINAEEHSQDTSPIDPMI